MGTYATFDDTVHPTQADELAEYCTACRNTGWVEYPVTVHETELDPCPHGCMDKEELLELGDWDAVFSGHYDQWLALQPEEYHDLPEEYDALHQQAQWETEAAPDPFLTLSKQFRARGVTPYMPSPAAKHMGTVSSDDYVQGFMRTGHEVHHISIPPYLVGHLIEFDTEYAHIRYEYMGSYLEVYVSAYTLGRRMRFSYSWDRNYSTQQMLG